MNSKTRLFLDFLKGNRVALIGAVLAVALAAGFSFIAPLVIKLSIDSLIGNKQIDAVLMKEYVNVFGGKEYLANNLWVIALTLLIFTGLQGIFTYLKGRWSATASEGIALKIRDRLYDHLQRLPFSYHCKAETGDLIQRSTSDVDTIRRFLGFQLIEIGRALLILLGVIPIMLSLNLEMTLISMSIVPIIFLFAFVFFLKIKKSFKESDEAEGALSNTLQENLVGNRVVRAFNRADFEIAKFEKKNKDYREKTYKVIRLLALYWSSSDLLCMLQIAVILIIGAYKAVSGQITIGTLVVFLTYERALLWPIRQMGRILTDLGKASVAFSRIKEILDLEPEKYQEDNQKEIDKKINGKIEFENICFAYEKEKILENISFSAEPGETIAILGPTGSGKSTLVNLLPRLYEYNTGKIKIDGRELKTYSKEYIRNQIAVVLQEPFLFSKTIEDNVKLANENIERDKLIKATQTAYIHDVICDFEKGYSTKVGEKGVTLSGGQKQRLAIARALVQEAPILIFDDSLSAVDTETDLKIRNRLTKFRSKATTFIISHRITTVADADKILVMDQGKIIQQGTHQDLMKKSGQYRKIWKLQNSLNREDSYEMDDKIDDEYEEYDNLQDAFIKIAE